MSFFPNSKIGAVEIMNIRRKTEVSLFFQAIYLFSSLGSFYGGSLKFLFLVKDFRNKLVVQKHKQKPASSNNFRGKIDLF